MKRVADWQRQRGGQLLGDLLADRLAAKHHAETELGVILKQRVCPGRPVAAMVGGIGHRRRAGAPDRRAAGGVGDQHPVAKQLGDKPGIGRFSATRAGAGKLQQRRFELTAFDRRFAKRVIFWRQSQGVIPDRSHRTLAVEETICSALPRDGQLSTQLPQPEQSSGEMAR